MIKMTGTSKVFTDLNNMADYFTPGSSRNYNKVKAFCEILAEYGRMKAEDLYDAAVMIAGNETPTVNAAKWVNDTTLVLTAEGKDILFVEFGTGILNFSNTYPTDTPDAARNASQFYGSSYSATHKWIDSQGVEHGGWLVEPKVSRFNGWWPYNGRWWSGNPPAKAMYEAGKYMRDAIAEAAERAFG